MIIIKELTIRESIREAKRLNLKEFLSVIPCSRHKDSEGLTVRKASQGQCAECHRENAQRVYQAQKDKRKAQMIAYSRSKMASLLHYDTARRIGLKLSLTEAEAMSGYTSETLRTHLESLWSDGMSWETYGGSEGWQIDHIKPLSVFMAEGCSDVSVIDALSNLQPLWAYDNKSKKDSYYQ